MHPLAKRHFEKVLGKGELLGIDKNCRYYPCHRGGLEDCTFCFCPFYPCGDESTGANGLKVRLGHVKIVTGFIGLKLQGGF